MKKLINLLVLLVVGITAQAKCDWSGYWMEKTGQYQNSYQFQTNVDWDSCVDYWWIIYDYQLKRKDTIKESFKGTIQPTFNVKGKYKVVLHVFDQCNKCDTNFIQEIDITIYGKADVGYKIGAKNCKYYTFEMTNMNDTCVEYYYAIYKSKYFDTMSQSQWERLSDSAIYFGYDFGEDDLVYYNMSSQRVVTHEFVDSGRHLLWAYWYNKCTGIDTWVMRKVDVCVSRPVNGLTPITPSVGGMIRPNPSSCEFYITDTRTPMEYMILNTSGTIIAMGNTSPFEQTRIESCNWPNGVYYIWVMGLGRELIMIQH